ncbi:MAG: RHS repeat-associated core domain-containing protein [Chloroflexaceae bacterium]|nr:RHS repeat-associated core domain-containing protein [Chloroflexaceae bacterium]
MRLTLDDAGVPIDPSGYSYTPFGIPQSGAQPEPFGFAAEQWDAATGLVYLRARWYDPASGTFLGRDPFEGFPDMPYSQHPYQYGYSNPALYVDPTGLDGGIPGCRPEDRDRLECDTPTPAPPSPSSTPTPSPSPTPTPSPSPIPTPSPSPSPTVCPENIEKPTDIGYLEGANLGWWGIIGVTGGGEVIYDLYDFESAIFAVAGWGGQLSVGIEGTVYAGFIRGWSTYAIGMVDNYAGIAVSASAGVAIPVSGIGVSIRVSWSQRGLGGAQLWGISGDINGGGEFESPFTVGAVVSNAWIIEQTKRTYYDRRPDGTKEIRREHGVLFASDILNTPGFVPGRIWAAAMAIRNAVLWEQNAAQKP